MARSSRAAPEAIGYSIAGRMRISDVRGRIAVLCFSACASAGLSGAVVFGCASPDQPPGAVKLAPVDWEPAREIGLAARTVEAIVTVNSKGDVIGVQLPKSTGDKQLDRAVMKAARQSTYTPQIKDCRPVTGSLLVKFALGPD